MSDWPRSVLWLSRICVSVVWFFSKTLRPLKFRPKQRLHVAAAFVEVAFCLQHKECCVCTCQKRWLHFFLFEFSLLCFFFVPGGSGQERKTEKETDQVGNLSLDWLTKSTPRGNLLIGLTQTRSMDGRAAENKKIDRTHFLDWGIYQNNREIQHFPPQLWSRWRITAFSAIFTSCIWLWSRRNNQGPKNKVR